MNEYSYYLLPIGLFIIIMTRRHILHTKWEKAVKANCGKQLSFINIIKTENSDLTKLHLGHYVLLAGDVTVDVAVYPLKNEDGSFIDFPTSIRLSEKLMKEAKQVIIREKGKRIYTKAELTREEMYQG